MRTPTQEELIQILRFEIRGTPLPQGFSVSDEAALVQLAKNHDLAHFVYDALTKNGLPCTSQFAMQQYFASIWRAEQMGHELLDLAELFEKEGIDFIPLKGAVMRPMYPESWMRTSADIDVLVRSEDQLRARDLLAGKLGYSFDPNEDRSHHIGMSAPHSDVHVELHYTLFSDHHIGQTIRDMVSGLWNGSSTNGTAHITPKNGWTHWQVMSDAMFYFYHLAHMAKHMTLSGGCPVRALIDLWILDRLPQRDEPGRKALTEQGGLVTFGQQMSVMADAWLGTASGDGSTQFPPVPSEELEQYILTGNLYGDIDRRTANSVEKSGTAGYILQRIFLPRTILKSAYPILEEHPWLTPFCQIARWTKVFRKKYRNNLKNQTKALVHSGDDDVQQAQQISRILDIENI